MNLLWLDVLELLCTAILEVKRDHIHIHADAGERFEHPVRIERLPAKGAGNLLSQCAVPEHHWPWRVLRSHGMLHINPTNLRGAIHIVFQGSLQMTMAMLAFDEMREVVPAQSALTSAEVLQRRKRDPVHRHHGFPSAGLFLNFDFPF